MLGYDQSIKDFPPWLLPYIRIPSMARADVSGLSYAQGVPTPQPARLAHLLAIVSAATLSRFVAGIPDVKLREQLEPAASATFRAAIDDCGNDRRRPWPRPPRHLELLSIAADLAIVAAETGDEVVNGALVRAVDTLSERAARELKTQE